MTAKPRADTKLLACAKLNCQYLLQPSRQRSRVSDNFAAKDLAKRLVEEGLIPETSAEDTLHMGLATVHAMDFLMTWNFRPINNAEMKARIFIIAGISSATIKPRRYFRV